MTGNRWVMNVLAAAALMAGGGGCLKNPEAPAPSTRPATSEAPDLQAMATWAADQASSPAVPAETTGLLNRLKAAGRTDHLPYLAEYGLRLHLSLLKKTGLARELPVQDNLALAELVRLAKIEQYTSAHEAGWLNRQFDGVFTGKGWSSYQVYIWCKENWSSLQDAPNIARLAALLGQIDATGASGVGGKGNCHYNCQ